MPPCQRVRVAWSCSSQSERYTTPHPVSLPIRQLPEEMMQLKDVANFEYFELQFNFGWFYVLQLFVELFTEENSEGTFGISQRDVAVKAKTIGYFYHNLMWEI
jgi:hypothetical protein